MDPTYNLAREGSCNSLRTLEWRVTRSRKFVEWIQPAVFLEWLSLWFDGHKGPMLQREELRLSTNNYSVRKAPLPPLMGEGAGGMRASYAGSSAFSITPNPARMTSTGQKILPSRLKKKAKLIAASANPPSSEPRAGTVSRPPAA
jgi:hypothetical protein